MEMNQIILNGAFPARRVLTHHPSKKFEKVSISR